MFEFSIQIQLDNTKDIEEALQTQGKVALEACGMKAEGFAKAKCPVDTGLLRNSITYAVSGGKAAIESYISNDSHKTTPVTLKAGTAGKPVSPKKEGTYEGTAPDEGLTMFLGTNVEYAYYVEEGAGKWGPRRFLRPALENHKKEYKALLEEYLSK